MNVSDFLANISINKDFARPNKYSIEIFPPSGINIDTTTLKSICLNCKNTTFPGKSIDAAQHIAGGYIMRHMPFGVTYSPISIIFNLSSDHKEKTFWETWMNLIYNDTSNTINYYDNYVGSIIVSQLDRSNKPKKSYQLFECYPQATNETSVGNDMQDSISELTVSINYRSYKPIQI